MKRISLILTFAAILFASCGKDDENQVIENLEEKIIGKWMVSEIDGQTALTNSKVVYTFVSPTVGYCSAASADFTETAKMWNSHVESSVSISGNDVTITGNVDENYSYVATLTVKSISENEMLTDSKYKLYLNGELISNTTRPVRWTKVTVDYSQAILGCWEGHITSEQSRFDNGELHRWEYLEDETYIYWSLDEDGEWGDFVNTATEYFVDGNLLCTRWKNRRNETEYREWWEIASIENGVMNWTALRQDEEGNTFTASFSMTKVTPQSRR